ncbi:hypothetical protein FCH28_31010 [Streptomyces piniterrae]|uniref:ParB-like N-terminal domain-containing protein n=2 Tax=Streptomyces piniterrae TaxID=2571125 RepID=A0A4U0MT98_9ACTN|nr:hypothetical protein FCH28_31010 [Streptomyces piniterrae]
MVPIAALRPADSPRTAGESSDHVRRLAELNTPLPPIVVHRQTMRVVDGMHRVRAAILRGEEYVAATFFEGSSADAFVLAVGLNSAHGLPLSSADRSAAAARIIRSHPQWSDRMVASATGLPTRTVAALRGGSTDPGPQLNTPKGRDGRTGREGRARPRHTAAGRELAGRLVAERPDASLRDIAARAGIAVATAKDVRDRIRQGRDPVPQKLRKDEAVRKAVAPPSALSGRGVGDVRNGADVRNGGDVPGAGGIRGAGGGWARPAKGRMDSVSVLGSLRKDPSLRQTELGRALLQLLSAHAISEDKWQLLADSVPAHCSDAVAQLAHRCSEEWLRFAQEVGRGEGHPKRTGSS